MEMFVEFPEAEIRDAMGILTFSDFRIWVAIKLRIMHNNTQNEGSRDPWPCVISIAQIVEDTGISNVTVINSTKRLVERGYLKRRRDPITRTYAYSEPALLPFEKQRPIPRKRKRIAA